MVNFDPCLVGSDNPAIEPHLREDSFAMTTQPDLAGGQVRPLFCQP
jgi:hypothetical protein